MKGIVFNLLEQVVVDEFGEETWDALLESANVEGAYTAVGSYPDAALLNLVSAASSAISKSADEVVEWFGRAAVPLLFQRYPQFFDPHTSTKQFMLTLNEVIHPEVRKLFPGADVPEFDFESRSENQLVLGYMSQRKLCSFAEGLIEGASEHFGEKVTVEHTECMKRGDAKCTLLCTFTKL